MFANVQIQPETERKLEVNERVYLMVAALPPTVKETLSPHVRNKFIANFAYLVKQHENVYSPSEYVCVCVCGKRFHSQNSIETLTILQ